MGGRGASYSSYKNYGSEYDTLYQWGNIKFIKASSTNKKGSVPLDTRTKIRVYVVVSENSKGEDILKSIAYYDSTGKRYKQVDLNHWHKQLKPQTAQNRVFPTRNSMIYN